MTSQTLVQKCTYCEEFPEREPFTGRYVCDCGKVTVLFPGKWYTCANCERRFKDSVAEYLCPECT